MEDVICRSMLFASFVKGSFVATSILVCCMMIMIAIVGGSRAHGGDLVTNLVKRGKEITKS